MAFQSPHNLLRDRILKTNIKVDLIIIIMYYVLIKSSFLKISKIAFLQAAAPKNSVTLGLARLRPQFLLRSFNFSRATLGLVGLWSF